MTPATASIPFVNVIAVGSKQNSNTLFDSAIMGSRESIGGILLMKYNLRAGWIIFVLAAGATVPSAIIPVYERMFHMSVGLTESAFVVYGVLLLPSLVYFGSLSDKIGRKKILTVGTFVMIIPTLILAYPANVTDIVVGRAIQGGLLGALVGTSTAFFIELSDDSHRASAAKLSGFIITFGYAAGPAISGTVLLFHGSPVVPFLIIAFALVLSTVFAFTSNETIHPMGRDVEKQKAAPNASMSVVVFFKSVALPAFSTFAVGNVSLSVLPIYMKKVFVLSTAVAPAFYGYTETLLLVSAAVAQMILGRVDSRKLMVLGLVSEGVGQFLLSIGGMITSMVLLVFSTVVIGCGFGLTVMATVREANGLANKNNRGKVMAWMYVAQYIGFIIPTLVVGYVSDYIGLVNAFIGFGVFMVIYAVFAIYAGRYLPFKANSTVGS